MAALAAKRLPPVLLHRTALRPTPQTVSVVSAHIRYEPHVKDLTMQRMIYFMRTKCAVDAYGGAADASPPVGQGVEYSFEFNANGHEVTAQLDGLKAASGCKRVRLMIKARCLKGAKGADLLVTMGGASVGDYDLVGKVLGDQGMDLGFYKVAMRPGKPLIFGRLGDVPVLGLPGNPVSAAVSTIIFVRAAIQVMLGRSTSATTGETAILGEDLPENDERQDYLRSQFSKDANGNPVVVPAKMQDSAMLARLAKSDCLVIRVPFAKPAKAGELVEIITLGKGILTI